MTTDGTEYLVRCFAYSMDGQRCEQLAGHDGNHAVVKEWTDEECFTPLSVRTAAPAAPPSDPTLGQSRGDEPCLICGHTMHRGRCTGMDGEFPCDCANGV